MKPITFFIGSQNKQGGNYKLGKTEKYDHMKLIRKYAGGHKNLIALGRCLAAVSAVMTLIPYYELWKIIRTAVNGENLDDIKAYA